jgi:hypothetical protein
VTLTYDNEHVPLMNCEVLHSEYEDALSISGVYFIIIFVYQSPGDDYAGQMKYE